jgi:hypothetical protein
MQAPGAGFYTVTVTGVVGGMLPGSPGGPSDDCVYMQAPGAGFYTVTVTGVVGGMLPPKPGDLLTTLYLYAGSWSWVLHCYSDRSGWRDAPPQARGPTDEHLPRLRSDLH